MLQNNESVQTHGAAITNEGGSGYEGDEEVDRILDAVINVLDIDESWVKFIMVDTSKGKKLEDGFAMPSGMGIGGGEKYIIAIDGELWTKYVKETNQKKKKICRICAYCISRIYASLSIQAFV